MSSIFTRIINGEIPCTKVYEDDLCLAFLDINPVSKGHTLLIPKTEYVRMTDTPDDIIAHLFKTAKKIMKGMKNNLGVDYVQLSVEGIEVPHFHIHLIPNQLGNHIVTWSHVSYTEGEVDEIARKISQ